MKKMQMIKAGLSRITVAAVVVMAVLTAPLKAHEFWLTPQQWQVKQGQTLGVGLYLGAGFNGSQQIYFPARITRFDLISPAGDSIAFKGRLGDRPAGRITPQTTGLHIIAHETSFSLLRYDGIEKFAAFTNEKGFDDAVMRHHQRGLPQKGFVERYHRFAKSLVAVGTGEGLGIEGQDRVLGMEVEITALINPFDHGGDTMPLRLDRDGTAWGHAMVTVFARPVGGRPDETVMSRYRTDDSGLVSIAVEPGHDYLIDAVSLEETAPAPDNEGAVWTSRWASLTFTLPG